VTLALAERLGWLSQNFKFGPNVIFLPPPQPQVACHVTRDCACDCRLCQDLLRHDFVLVARGDDLSS